MSRKPNEAVSLLAGPAELSELTSVVAHQLNNHLNGILLQVAVLERGVLAQARSELQVIRQLGNEAATLVRRLQERNALEQPQMQRIELNGVVRDAVTEVSSPAAVEPELAQHSPVVMADPSYLRRLLKLLLNHCVAVVSSDSGKVVVRTAQIGAKGVLQVEDMGPRIPEEALSRLFDPFVAVRERGDDITLAICKLLARRLRASLDAKNRPQQGVAFRIELDAPREVSEETGLDHSKSGKT
jgi:C4-dicarboxylate-specific signal transduction histidine kinase